MREDIPAENEDANASAPGGKFPPKIFFATEKLFALDLHFLI